VAYRRRRRSPPSAPFLWAFTWHLLACPRLLPSQWTGSGPGAASDEVAHDGGDDQGSGDDEQPLEPFDEQAEETEENGKDK